MEKTIDDLFSFEKKSKIKAGEGKSKGKYKFFTSSDIQSKFYDEYQFDKESLIFGTGGNPSLHYCNEKFSTSTDCFVINLKENNILTKYVYYFLRNNMNILEKGFKGAGIKHISKKYIQNITIKYPEDITIQKQIIEKLNFLYQLKNYRNKSIELMDELTKSIFYNMFLEKDFPKEKLKNFTSLITSGSTPKGGRKNYSTSGPILFIRSQNVLMNKFSNHDALYISKKIHENMQRTWLKNNDVLLNITGASIGRTAIYKGKNDKANVNQHVAIIRIKDQKKLNPTFLNYYLSSDIIQNHIKTINAGATREALNFSQIGNFDIPLIPIKFQEEYEKIIDKINTLKKEQKKK